MERLHATEQREPCQILSRIEACRLESSPRLPHFAFMSMVDQGHSSSRLTPHGTGSETGEVMHRSADSSILALSNGTYHCVADQISAWQMITKSRTRGLFCRKPQTIMADCRICHKRCNRKIPNRRWRWRLNGQRCGLPWCVLSTTIMRFGN